MHEINLGSVGGADWSGFVFEPAGGRARHWVITVPVGKRDTYQCTAEDVRGVYALQHQVGFLQMRVRELEEIVRGAAAHFTLAEIAVLRTCSSILQRALPQLHRSRFAPSPLALVERQLASEHDTARVLSSVL
jgi:hypothetical protein